MEKPGIVSDPPLPRQPQPGGAWQRELAEAVTDPVELLRRVGLTPADLGLPDEQRLRAACDSFGLRVPAAFIDRMRHGDRHDPLLRQVLPLPAELADVPGFIADPLRESAVRAAPGLLHKYAGRALLVTTAACAVHCRYCFRREFDYDGGAEGARWEAALQVVQADASLRELLLSGGDPLSLANPRLAALAQRAASIPHLKRLRLHTRTPVVLPSRVDDGLLEALRPGRLQHVMVIHANHAAELDDAVIDALRRLRAAGLTLLNQTVLLAGVNDDLDTLAALSERLAEAGVLPYYLHLLDRVRGAAHFDVPAVRGRELLQGLQACLPGYLVPRLVREEPGAPGKTLVL
ncbi:MAG: hypothetical protein RL026_1229 [Pseudomonadota bacterium]|jgi:EF-P beta-lysylation protein EpmB